MKAIGIVREIDKLGRVVIPKEVRRTQGWEEGQPMEMFMDGDKLVITAYKKDDDREMVINQLNLLLDLENEAVRLIARNALDFLDNKKA